MVVLDAELAVEPARQVAHRLRDGVFRALRRLLHGRAVTLDEARLFGIVSRLALCPHPGVTRAPGGETTLGARGALGTLRKRRGPAALDAQAALPAFGDASVVARQLALPSLGGVLVGHDGLLPANPETDGGRPAGCPIRETGAGRQDVLEREGSAFLLAVMEETANGQMDEQRRGRVGRNHD